MSIRLKDDGTIDIDKSTFYNEIVDTNEIIDTGNYKTYTNIFPKQPLESYRLLWFVEGEFIDDEEVKRRLVVEEQKKPKNDIWEALKGVVEE